MAIHVGMGLCRVLLFVGAGDSLFHSDLGLFFLVSILVLTDLIELFSIPRVVFYDIQVIDARGRLDDIGLELTTLQQLVWGLGGPKNAAKLGFLGSGEARSLKGLQHIAEAIESGNFDNSRTEAILQNDVESLDNLKSLSRFELTLLSC
ncbi:hypothetical protein B296_00028772 [Ensete ventricosum]|uniref:Uncharacterized protein n=1 Tax=Ensete ventricosum TaxID=4639 RepID=A0A427AM84_ENSVE|nr:hypothetical protein B296_00028772 [Ensete ventricosum]